MPDLINNVCLKLFHLASLNNRAGVSLVFVGGSSDVPAAMTMDETNTVNMVFELMEGGDDKEMIDILLVRIAVLREPWFFTNKIIICFIPTEPMH